MLCATAKDPGYCPPMIHTIAGKRQIVAWWPEGVAGLEPESGKELWRAKGLENHPIPSAVAGHDERSRPTWNAGPGASSQPTTAENAIITTMKIPARNLRQCCWNARPRASSPAST